jgi:hypothetical protein
MKTPQPVKIRLWSAGFGAVAQISPNFAPAVLQEISRFEAAHIPSPLASVDSEFFQQQQGRTRRIPRPGVIPGRTILLRFVLLQLSPDACRFEQAFSDDGGKTWGELDRNRHKDQR